MIINYLKVQDWRGLSIELPNFHRGLNLITGPNESGKSRLVEALRFGLFESSKGHAAYKQSLVSKGRIVGNPSITLEFELQGQRWKIQKEFLGKHAQATVLQGPALLEGEAAEAEVAEELGEARVQAWRHGLRDRPPPMPANHPLDVSGDRNYADLESTPRTESLEDTMQRALPLWRERIEPDLRSGKTVLVVAHGNSLRGLVKHVDGADSA